MPLGRADIDVGLADPCAPQILASAREDPTVDMSYTLWLQQNCRPLVGQTAKEGGHDDSASGHR